MHGCFLLSLALAVALTSFLFPSGVIAQSRVFPMPTGLEKAVQFWKQIFTRYSFAEVVLFDPLDHGTIYSVVRAPDTEAGRALVEREKIRIAADYDLADPEARLRAQRGAREHFTEGLRLAGRYIDEMKQIFREEGLPEELTYLPLVESSFNIRARSSVGALGMWQFMPDTGKKFLRIDENIDERRDPLLSTRAAARLLKQNYRLFESWPLAITAYNHGTEGIFRGMKATESEDLGDLIKHYQSPTFGFASKNFYAEFLAVADIAARQQVYFPSLRAHPPLRLFELEVKRQSQLHAVLKPAAISQNEFFEWNPALDENLKTLPLGYRIKLPPHKMEAFALAEKRAWDAAAKKTKVVRVNTKPSRGAQPPARASAQRQTRVAGKSSPAQKSRPSVSVASGSSSRAGL